ncbi:hypothetical protein CHLNCDRAFT_141140 [Chlorella variabilis]|uniref:PIN domain-containing protein n=1 Tax=Chlorella variabilis TaxID=554065 RepID=E1ZS77_CHLVA|nr:hypothetical protein CHLNCDRAFT_141140 [Chlorella variabilis]EFN51366.1 hypothetical protein CHLNCDRAFT_141140 [Chlorella variabilis]|eukprot:XP_005843468.1 hypothetical protein CHLNCDRAFT_141140 [Chlorella variabilis]
MWEQQQAALPAKQPQSAAPAAALRAPGAAQRPPAKPAPARPAAAAKAAAGRGAEPCLEEGEITEEGNSSSSCSDSDDGASRRRQRQRASRRRRSRSPLRRVAGGAAAGKRRAATQACAAPSGPLEAQHALASLVESMSAEAASLHRQLGRLGASSGAIRPAPHGGARGGGEPAQPASSAVGVAGAADMERQLATLSSKLGQLQLPSASEAGVTLVCWDTNVYMDHCRLIQECWERLLASGCADLRFLVPLAVVRELDGMKKCLFRGLWARRAIRRLADMQGHPALRGQREDELLRGQLRRNDDGILDCLLYFRARGAQVELCTRDVNLALRARIEGIPCCEPQEARRRLIQRLEAASAEGKQAAK